MKKIIAINENGVIIGSDDGSTMEVPHSKINFHPFVGDDVLVNEHNGEIIVTKISNNANSTTTVNNMVDENVIAKGIQKQKDDQIKRGCLGCFGFIVVAIVLIYIVSVVTSAVSALF